MKTRKIITHPYLLTISFCFILISGQHLGGFYLMYILMALPHGGIHALLAIAGIVILLMSHNYFKREKKYVIEPILNIIGAACLVLSLFFFFYNDRQGYNYGTFEQLVPQITLALFGILTIGFIVNNLIKSGNKIVNGNLSLKKA